jgi:hypothetical protein
LAHPGYKRGGTTFSAQFTLINARASIVRIDASSSRHDAADRTHNTDAAWMTDRSHPSGGACRPPECACPQTVKSCHAL